MTRQASVPEWAKEELPAWVRPYVGPRALPDRTTRGEHLADNCAGLDWYQGNNWIFYCPETAGYLYGAYTRLEVAYRKGLYPRLEALAENVCAGARTESEKARRMIAAVVEHALHPAVPPCCRPLPADRALDEEALLASGEAWCNEQARIFVRMAQSQGIAARLAFLFYADGASSHAIAEAHVDGKWAMVDATYGCVFPGSDGELMSAAEVHVDMGSRLQAGRTLAERTRALADLPDERMVGRKFADIADPAERRRRIATDAEGTRARHLRHTAAEQGAKLCSFGLLNHPLPHRHAAR